MVFTGVFAPGEYQKPATPFTGYDPARMQAAIAPEQVRRSLETILAAGSRYMGQPGFYATERYLQERFTEAGLETWQQDVTSVAPQTLRAEVESEGAVHQARLYPFLPNQLQPMNTPAGGLTGELILLTSEVLRNRADFTRCIGLLDVSDKAPKDYGYDWTRYAQLGIRAVVVAHPEGLEAVNWIKLRPMVSTPNPVNYVRLAASREIFDLVGKNITLHVRTVYRPVDTRTLVARLAAGTPATEAPATEAVIIPTSYDAASILPDLAPGTAQALPVAVQLGLLDGLATYREQLRRDVIFICFGARTMAQDSQNRLLAALGQATNIAGRHAELVRERDENESSLEQVPQLLALFEDQQFFSDPNVTVERLGEIGPAAAVFEKQCTYVRNTIVFELSEYTLQAKILFRKDPEQDLDGEAFTAFTAAKKRYDKAFVAAGYNIAKLLRKKKEYLAEHDVRRRLKDRLAALVEYHQQVRRRLEQDLALNELFARYERLVVLAPELAAREIGPDAAPGPEDLSFTMGPGANYVSEHPLLVRNHMIKARQRLGLKDEDISVSFTGRWHGGSISSRTGSIPVESHLWGMFSYPAFSLVNGDRAESYTSWFDPVDLPYVRSMGGMDHSLAVVGESVLSAAFGNGRFPGVKTRGTIPTFNGNVYVANVGQSILPNYPMPGALLACKEKNSYGQLPGYLSELLFRTNPYGHYEYPYCATFFGPMYGYSPDAAIYGTDGVISHIKDCGMTAQAVYHSLNLGGAQISDPVNLSLYRAAPVTVLDMINPQTLKPFAGVGFVRSRGLAAFPSTNVFDLGGIVTTFVKPDERFFVTLKAGSAENELAQTIRAFMLGPQLEDADGLGGAPATGGREIAGEGYLAQDSPLLLDMPLEIARSMISVNAKRLAVQNRKDYRLADERTEAFHDQSLVLLERAEAGQVSKHEALLSARDAAAYAELNHPVLRGNIHEAIIGILWYLGLLVPFVFFFEKLVFGFADIRKQLAAVGVVFLLVFALLRILHPAFAMIRSSIMILLGFVIMLISFGITVLFSSKFQDNLEQIRRRRGRITAAEVNKLGVLATAFLLGLNNMHRRRVRTWLTCCTLVLMTFVLISFTSVQSDLVDTQVAVGKASFSGLVVKNERFKPVADAELFALRNKYAHRCEVVQRHMYVGQEDWTTRERFNPQVRVTYTPADAPLKEAVLESVLSLGPAEPLARQITLLTPRNGWFTQAQADDEEGLIPIMISKEAAAKLGITPEMVQNTDELIVNVNDKKVRLFGIFNAESLGAVRDLDGMDILPFDVTALRDINKGAGYIIAEDDDPRIAPEKILLAPSGRWNIPVGKSTAMIHSIVVVIPPHYRYKDSKALIDRYLEQTGRATYYGLDGFSFRGRRAREQTVEGLVEMLIPLIIAALTVLNTMKGSVYERKDEIFVYSSVGIAPRHIFFMFFTEATVYAVVGSVLGYLLSQGTGRVLMLLDFTGGLNMTFASASTIYASLAIGASVFISTYFPARTAMQIATPTEDVGWRLPEPVGDLWSFPVPFTFGFRDRMAILAFFSRYFEDHGEGGSGRFFAEQPRLGVSDALDPLANDAHIPQLEVPIWLKPFDLGVSQLFRMSIATDPETGEYIPTVTLERLSGTLESWTRLNRRFIGLIRRRLLHWRAVGEEQREQMFEEARTQMHHDLYEPAPE